MATRKPDTALAPKEQPGALANRQSFIEAGDRTGTEGIGADDIRLPRLGIAQGLSPQMLPDDSQYIPDLKLFEMFNDLTGDIYGRGPLYFVPVRRDVRRIEFDPEDGKKVIDFNVPPVDPRNEWTTDPESGERVPPRATKFVEFVVLLVKEDGLEPIVLSIKQSNKFNTRAAERLSSFIKLRQKPIYAGFYSVESKSEKNDQGTFGVYVVSNVRSLDDPKQDDESWAKSVELYNYAKQFAASLEGKTITLDREVGADDFDPAAMEGAPKM